MNIYARMNSAMKIHSTQCVDTVIEIISLEIKLPVFLADSNLVVSEWPSAGLPWCTMSRRVRRKSLSATIQYVYAWSSFDSWIIDPSAIGLLLTWSFSSRICSGGPLRVEYSDRKNSTLS